MRVDRPIYLGGKGFPRGEVLKGYSLLEKAFYGKSTY